MECRTSPCGYDCTCHGCHCFDTRATSDNTPLPHRALQHLKERELKRERDAIAREWRDWLREGWVDTRDSVPRGTPRRARLRDPRNLLRRMDFRVRHRSRQLPYRSRKLRWSPM